MNTMLTWGDQGEFALAAYAKLKGQHGKGQHGSGRRPDAFYAFTRSPRTKDSLGTKHIRRIAALPYPPYHY
jgi:hypothetical protein